MSIIIVTAVHGIRPYRDDCLAPSCFSLVQNTKTGAKNIQCLHFNSASLRKEISWPWEDGGWMRGGRGGGGGLGDDKEVQVVDKCHDKIIQET